MVKFQYPLLARISSPQGLGFRVWRLGFRVWGLGFGVLVFGFWIFFGTGLGGGLVWDFDGA